MGTVSTSSQDLKSNLTPLPRSQGNGARATQLKWQRERNEQLARNYKRELEEKQKKKQSEIMSFKDASDSNLFTGPVEIPVVPARLPSEHRRVKVTRKPTRSQSRGAGSDTEHVRHHTREHLTRSYKLEDGSEVTLSRLHLARARTDSYTKPGKGPVSEDEEEEQRIPILIMSGDENETSNKPRKE